MPEPSCAVGDGHGIDLALRRSDSGVCSGGFGYCPWWARGVGIQAQLEPKPWPQQCIKGDRHMTVVDQGLGIVRGAQ